MAQQLSVGLYCEGESDYEYFTPLLGRVLRDLLARTGIDRDVPPVTRLIEPQDGIGDYSSEAIRDWSEWGLHKKPRHLERHNRFTLLILHMDANAPSVKDSRAYKNTGRQLSNYCEEPERWIPLIPVREAEAWQVADRDLLAQVCRVSLADVEERFQGRTAEKLTDPKAVRDELLRAGRVRYRRGILQRLASPNLDTLRQLESFHWFEKRLLIGIRTAGGR